MSWENGINFFKKIGHFRNSSQKDAGLENDIKNFSGYFFQVR